MTSFWLALAACTGPAALPSGSSGVCEAAAAEAEKRVTSVVPGHLDCAVDEDCQAVVVMASCFNDCAMSLNRAGAGAVDRASTL
ncbi:MAG: hypothetical protein JNK04_03515, partial [Myxococcales bacterium]|nr:hypothetical protein [Myxococcales bacterium]